MAETHRVTLRPGRPEDVDRLAAYHHRCVVEAFAPLVGPEVVERLDPERSTPMFEHWLSADSLDTSVVVAEVGGVAVGHTVVAGHQVFHVFVDPDHWGAGIGRQLLGTAEDLVAANGFDTAELHTRVGNTRAIGLYESAGWKVTDQVLHTDEGDLTYDEHILLKHLGR